MDTTSLPEGKTPPNVTMSATAVARILALRDKKNNPNLNFRLMVDGGGCSGFQYIMEVSDKTLPEDICILQNNGVSILIDIISAPLLEGAEVDYKSELGNAYFKINNPNADSSCGCGVSFSVKN